MEKYGGSVQKDYRENFRPVQDPFRYGRTSRRTLDSEKLLSPSHPLDEETQEDALEPVSPDPVPDIPS